MDISLIKGNVIARNTVNLMLKKSFVNNATKNKDNKPLEACQKISIAFFTKLGVGRICLASPPVTVSKQQRIVG